MDPTGALRLTAARGGHRDGMRLKTTLVALAIAGSTALTGGLTGCAGTNTDIGRGETDCDGGNNNTHDENCPSNEPIDPSDNN